MIENIDGGTTWSHEGDVQGPARLRALTDPEGWFAALKVGCLPRGTEGNGSAMAGLLGLAVALVFGAIAVLEFRQNAYVSALLRSFGAPGKSLYIRQWLENAVLANLAAISALLLLACFHKELFGALGFPGDLLNLNNVNPYYSWEIALVLLWVNVGAFLSSLSVAIGLKKPVGEILS